VTVGAEADHLDAAGRTALHEAAARGFVQVAAYLLRVARARPRVRSAAGLTPLLEAAAAGHAKCVNLLQVRAEAHSTAPHRTAPRRRRPGSRARAGAGAAPRAAARACRGGGGAGGGASTLIILISKCIHLFRAGGLSARKLAAQNADPGAADDADADGNTALHLAARAPAGLAVPSTPCACPRAPPPPRTKWTRRVPHPVLTGHAASLARAPLLLAVFAAAAMASDTRVLSWRRMLPARSPAQTQPPATPPPHSPEAGPCRRGARAAGSRNAPRLPRGGPRHSERRRRDAAGRGRGRRCAPPAPPSLPRTNRTSLVPPLVLSGHVASLTPY